MLKATLKQILLLAFFLLAAVPAGAARRQPGGPALAAIEVTPAPLVLTGPRAQQAVLVTGRYRDGTVRDLTAQARFKTADAAVAAASSGVVRPRGDGETTLTAEVAGAPPASVPVTVREFASPSPVSFRDDVVPALTRLGCSAGACHGTPTGKGGFRLSLQGYAPDFDYAQLALQGNGRRANRASPGSSLFLMKPTGRLPHGGGLRLREEDPEYRLLVRWVAEGLRDDPPTQPALTALAVLPGKRALMQPARTQQLVVLATFADGATRDVTPLVKFSCSDDMVAGVSRQGLVTATKRGEVAVLARYQHLTETVRLTFLEELPGFRWPDPPAQNAIDTDVFAKLRLLRIPPSGLCSDSEFIRRVTLDALGVLPTPDEVREFLGESEAERKSGGVGERGNGGAGPAESLPHSPTPPLSHSARTRLIDRVLSRAEFADFWALKWADVLRVGEQTLGEAGTRGYHRWLREAIAADRPLDQFVRELLTAQGKPAEAPAAYFYYAVSEPENWMEQTTQVFMGVRISCARCHNHPFDRWTQDEYYQLAAFFGQVRTQGSGVLRDDNGRERRERRERILQLEPDAEVVQPRTGKVMTPKLLGGPVPEIPAGQDRRPFLAAWLTSPENPFFARALANRIWFHVMGRGIVEPVDDFRDSNPPVNDALLATLTAQLAKEGFRLRPLVRFIMNSRTYQLSARPEKLNADDHLYFSHAAVRLLTAEQLMDGISQVTGVPEEFEGYPAGTRAAQLPGSRVGSPFLKTFGRPDRNLNCECERERDSNLFQALQMINGRTLHNKLRADGGRVAALARSGKKDDEVIDDLYLAALSRYPTPPEREAARRHLAAGERRAGLEDLLWALVNSKEFVFRH